MGVRIDMNVATVKGAGAKQAAAKKGDLTEGLQPEGGFEQELARAQPAKQGEVARREEPVAEKPVAKETPAKGRVEEDAPAEGEARMEEEGLAAVSDEEAVDSEGDLESVEQVEADEGDDADLRTFEAIDEEFIAQLNAGPARFEVKAPEAEGVEMDGATVVADEGEAVRWEQVDFERTPAVRGGKQQAEEEPAVRRDEVKPQTTAEIKPAVRPMEQQRQGGERQESWGGGVEAPKNGEVSEGKEQTAPAERFAELFEAYSDREPVAAPGRGGEQIKPVAEMAVPGLGGDAPAGVSRERGPDGVRPAAPAPPAPPAPPEVRFAEANHPKVVTAVKMQLLPGGGTIQLRLDPPDLGPLRLEVRMEGGQMSASFVAASDRAASLLTQSLGELKHALEGAGISVEKLQVRQGSSEQFAGDSERQKQEPGEQSSARQEQQRREMLERMWRKVAGGDPVDLVA